MARFSEVMRPKMSPGAEYALHEVKTAIDQIAAFVELIEANPDPVNAVELGLTLNNLSSHAISLNADLMLYGMFLPNVNEVILRNDDTIEQLGDRFIEACQPRKLKAEAIAIPEATRVLALPAPKPITSREAMEHFGKSRSTIYRWIKSGKIHAEKHGRFWQIYI